MQQHLTLFLSFKNSIKELHIQWWYQEKTNFKNSCNWKLLKFGWSPISDLCSYNAFTIPEKNGKISCMIRINWKANGVHNVCLSTFSIHSVYLQNDVHCWYMYCVVFLWFSLAHTHILQGYFTRDEGQPHKSTAPWRIWVSKSESDNEGPWLNWDWKWLFMIEMVKKISGAVTEFGQETENVHPWLVSHTHRLGITVKITSK